MVVLRQQNVEITENGQTVTRPVLTWVVGPYWFVVLCLTVPLFLVLAVWAGVTNATEMPTPVIVTWAAVNGGLFFSLFMVSCSDPGIMYRQKQPKQGWIWNDQALTFRPLHAKYDPDCGIVIEGFDHTCPWTGTAIGKKNMIWFRVFLVFVLATFVYDLVLITGFITRI
jgi:hypothetical protein